MWQSKRILSRGVIRGFPEASTHVDVLFEAAELLRCQCDGAPDGCTVGIANQIIELMKGLAIASYFILLISIPLVDGLSVDLARSLLDMAELDVDGGYPLGLAMILAISLAQMDCFWCKAGFAIGSTCTA